MKQKVIRIIKQVLGFLPSSLPGGVSEFDAWATDIIKTYDLPTTNEDSIKFTLATIIMHLGPQVATKPKYFFVMTLRAASAKQVAGQVFTDIKLRQQEEAAKASKAADEQSKTT